MDNSGQKTALLHFLPTISSLSEGRHEIEASKSSARSYLTTLQHRRRNVAAGLAVDIVATPSSPKPVEAEQQIIIEAKSSKTDSQFITSRWKVGNLLVGDTSKNGRHKTRKTFSPRPKLAQPGVKKTSSNLKALSRNDADYAPTPQTYRPESWSVGYAKLSDRNAVRLLHHAVNTYWPNLVPGVSESVLLPEFAASWDILEGYGETLFYAEMWETSINLQYLQKQKTVDQQSLHYYQRTIQGIAREITTKPAAQIREETMVAIMSLAAPEPYGVEVECDYGGVGFEPPFSDLSWIRYYGRKPLSDWHMKALYHLIDARGGLESLRMIGFAPGAFFMDLVKSTQNLRRAHFALPRCLQFLRDNNGRDNGFGLVNRPQKLYSSTPSSDHMKQENEPRISDTILIDALLVHYSLPDEVHQILLDLRTWVGEVLPDVSQATAPNFELFICWRDLIQHQLLATISVGDDIDHEEQPLQYSSNATSEEEEESMNMTRMVRLALLIFATGVTFPILWPRTQVVLARRLQRWVQQHKSKLLLAQGGTVADILVWICMLGALAAAQVGDAKLRSWFVDMLAQIESRQEARARAITTNNAQQPDQQLLSASMTTTCSEQEDGYGLTPPRTRTWLEVKQECLGPLLWCEIACEAGGKRIWCGVQDTMIGRKDA